MAAKSGIYFVNGVEVLRVTCYRHASPDGYASGCTYSPPFATFYVEKLPTTPATLSGFFPPVDEPDAAVNIAKAGRTIPLKFFAETEAGPITDLTSVRLDVDTYVCSGSASVDAIEAYSTLTDVPLQNIGAGYYQYNWRTPKEPGKCSDVTLSLPVDYVAPPLKANFQYRK